MLQGFAGRIVKILLAILLPTSQKDYFLSNYKIATYIIIKITE